MRSGVGPDTGDELEAVTGGVAAVMRGARPVTVKEAAQRARVSVKTIRRAYTRGDLPYYRPGGSHLVLMLDVEVDAWALQPVEPRPSSIAATVSRAHRPAVGRTGPRRRADPGGREDLRAIEQGLA